MRCTVALAIVLICFGYTLALGQNSAGPRVEQAVLTESGGSPFFMQAVITESGDPSEHINVEMSWLAPDKWKRTIRSDEFSQTLVVNGDKAFEEDSSDYLPLGIQVLTTAMLDPRPIANAVRPGDPVRTKENGASDESGKVCFGANSKMCVVGRHGLTEFLGAPGRSVDFMDYQAFRSKRVARTLVYHMDPGDTLKARIMVLGQLETDEKQFSISDLTPKEKQIRSVVVSQAELRDLALQPLEIIWPQVLEDSQTTGETGYYLSIDRSGTVREVLPLSVAVERADDSARRQIMKWTFKPLLREGVAVQMEGVLDFHFDTRQYGPSKALTNEEARKLASGVVEPTFPSGSTSGATYSVWIAVDSDGRVIEEIAGEGPRELSQACFQVIGKWQFHPIMEDGKPLPYRAQVTFRVP
jgi:hypothetical protein